MLTNVCACLLFESGLPVTEIFPKLENDQLKSNSDYGTAYKLCDVACVSRPPSFLKGVQVSHILNLCSYLPSGTNKPQLCRLAIASLMYSMAVSLKSWWNGNELMEAISQWENCFAHLMMSRTAGGYEWSWEGSALSARIPGVPVLTCCWWETGYGWGVSSVDGTNGVSSVKSRLFTTEFSGPSSSLADGKLWELWEVCCLRTARSCTLSGRRGVWFRWRCWAMMSSASPKYY